MHLSRSFSDNRVAQRDSWFGANIKWGMGRVDHQSKGKAMGISLGNTWVGFYNIVCIRCRLLMDFPNGILIP